MSDAEVWFPGYKAEVEENRFRKCCNWLLILTVICLAVAAICCGIFVMQPGVVFQSFELGDCRLKSLQFVEVKGCSCGKNCRSEFPCYTLDGTFDSQVAGSSPTEMELFNTYWDYKEGCVWMKCSKDKSENVKSIIDIAVKFYQDNGYDSSKLEDEMKNPTKGSIVDNLDGQSVKFECYGNNEGDVFMTYINSSLWIGCGAIPLILFVIFLVFFLKFATPGMKLVTVRFFCLPYYLITDRKTTCSYLCNPRSPCKRGYC